MFEVSYDFFNGGEGEQQAVWAANIASGEVKYVNENAKIFSWTPTTEGIGMLDKTKALTDGLSTINGLVGERFGWDTNSRETTDLIRQLMKPMQLAIYDFTVVCETQMLKCDKAGAYLAGCMMGAAMNEALLSLLCLFYEESVKETRHYKTATQRETYEAMVGNWNLSI